jgi:kinetochore protein Mis13/DSN1
MAEFYKHIDSESLPEPRRMKQLLIWCGSRALEDEGHPAPSKDSRATTRSVAAQGAQEDTKTIGDHFIFLS